MTLHRLAAATALALAFAAAQAAPLAADGSWTTFDVDDFSAANGGVQWIDIASGQSLSFDVTIPTGFVGTLTVVDGGLSGDRFAVSDFGNALGQTSAATPGSGNVFDGFDTALADARFSRGVFTLGAGSHQITGLLTQAAQDGINATTGGVRLTVSPVPEPASMAMLAAGLLLLTATLRRQGGKR